jgi:hypothetical protein
MAEARTPHDGTGGPCMREALQDAVASRMAAAADEAVTWSHLLVEAVAFVMVETDPGRLLARLEALDTISADWQAALKGRLSDTIHGPGCLCAKCNPEAPGFHNSKLALN